MLFDDNVSDRITSLQESLPANADFVIPEFIAVFLLMTLPNGPKDSESWDYLLLRQGHQDTTLSSADRPQRPARPLY